MTDPNLQPAAEINRAFASVNKIVADRLPETLADRDAIVAGLLLCFSLAVGQDIGDTKILAVDRPTSRAQERNSVNFQIKYLSSNDRQIELGVCVLQSRDPEVVDRVCNSLLGYKDFGLDRLCLLRTKEFNSTTPEFYRFLPKLLSPQIGGRLVYLDDLDLPSILSLLYLFHNRDKYHLPTARISEYFSSDNFISPRQSLNKILGV
jgi:hypothetical protein